MLLTDIQRPLDRSSQQAPAVPMVPARAAHHMPSLAQQVEITPASTRDWHAICVLVARNFPLETEANLGYWLCHQLPYFRVARIGNKTIGFLHAQPHHDTRTLWVNMLAVDERYRNRGVAHRLVEHFDSVCRDWACEQIGLQCLTSNSAALALYERHGYARLPDATAPEGMQVVGHRKTLPVTDTPRSCPRSPMQIDNRAVRLAYRLYYRIWFRARSPMPK